MSYRAALPMRQASQTRGGPAAPQDGGDRVPSERMGATHRFGAAICRLNVVDNARQFQQMTSDPTKSALEIQLALYNKYDAKFFVACAPASDEAPHRISAHGDGFCVATHNDVTCQVVSVSA